MQRNRRSLLTSGLLVLTALALTSPVLASSGGGGLPWESPLQQIQQSITGPVAGFIALAAVAIAGGMLIFGGELNDFARRLCYIALVGGVLLGATQIVSLFGATGATIGEEESGRRIDNAVTAELRRAGEGAHE
ncbi:TrbC/VirB2 family protein [Mesorhizobium sp.]|uniref:TrbC/VirB2 family protein n=1 Tax=Mesorhizobium sp. TaxID=1871066 RepID=UPI000FE55413|nr:TrbC/VirB2 family protein [Mesorhizobium sp.]RWN07735.1 MAG: conjugal transfer protein TrbC [Mesorhizobium sp.]RWN12347.1 MAG: conjugal transfer protein TrbC [Mesorhizobium sp.]TIQ97781.1 MAG: conjugal transfer protein TrbC [Mesorhizobium sp.]